MIVSLFCAYLLSVLFLHNGMRFLEHINKPRHLKNYLMSPIQNKVVLWVMNF